MATNNETYQAVTDKMLQALEAGVVPWRKPWSGGNRNAPRNAITGKAYRGMNIWILSWERMVRDFQDPRWLTFKQAMAVKGKFKGEKGDDIRKGTQVTLWKPMVKPVTDANGMPILVNGKPKMKQILFLRTFTVFNVEQFDDLKVKPLTDVPDPDPIEAAETILSGYTRGPKVRYGSDKAAYSPTLDYIEMPDRSAFHSIDQFYATSFHEMGHSTGHKSRLDRDEVNTFAHFGDNTYSKEELTAEMTSAMLCATAGIESTFDNSASYLASWIKVLKADNTIIMSAAGKAQRAADYILGTEYVAETEKDSENE